MQSKFLMNFSYEIVWHPDAPTKAAGWHQQMWSEAGLK
jgi:hypothetical protein